MDPPRLLWSARGDSGLQAAKTSALVVYVRD